MGDKIIRAIDPLGHVRFFVADTTEMVEEMRNIHQASTTATAAMGRLLTMMSLLSMGIENEGDSITVNIRADGPGGFLVGLTDAQGEARVTAEFPEAELPTREDGHLDVGGWVGHTGTLSMVRGYGLHELREPFSGVTNLVSGEVAEDFANYFYQSEQMPSVVSLGVQVTPDHSVGHAGGLFIQLMPDSNDAEITQLENIVATLPSMTQMLSDGLTPEEILQKYFAVFTPEVLGEMPAKYECHCSREKMHAALLSLEEEARRSMAEEDGGAEVVCEFCRKSYQFSAEELRREGEEW